MATKSSARNLSPLVVGAVAVLVSAVLGALTFWRVDEKDLFWLMHLGRDILASGHVAGVDTWSSTARGRPWPDYEWLSAVVFELVGRVKPLFHLLSGFRALVAVVPFLLLASRMRARRISDLVTFCFLAPVVYVICWERFYLRAELLAFALAFAPLVALWHSRARVGTKLAASVALLILWANLHAGTSILGILITVAWIAALPPRALPWSRRAVAMSAMALTWFCTPIGWAVVPAVWQNTVGANWSVQLNYDHMPLLPRLFDLSVEGWTYPFWVAMTLAGVIALWMRARHAEPGRRIGLGVILILVALTLGKVRARIYPTYLMAFELFPLIADTLAKAGRDRMRRWGVGAVIGIGVLVAWAGVAYQAVKIMPAFGAGLWVGQLPVETVQFLREDHPAGKVMNEWDYGGYLGYMAGDLYEVSSDGRALPFLDLEQELLDSQQRGPEDFAAHVAQHGFDIVLEKVPRMGFFDGVGYQDTHHAWFPSRTWALVAFDNASVVYLRRTPEHADEIAKREYRMLLRDRPPNFGTDSPDATPEQRAVFESELDTCLKRCPTCSYCLIGKACFLKERGSFAESESLIAAAERSPSPEFDPAAVYAVCGQKR